MAFNGQKFKHAKATGYIVIDTISGRPLVCCRGYMYPKNKIVLDGGGAMGTIFPSRALAKSAVRHTYWEYPESSLEIYPVALLK